MRAVSRRRSGQAEEESIAELSATTTTPPVVVWTPIRAAEDLRDTPYRSSRLMTSRSADQVASIAQTLLSTRPVGRVTSRTT